MRYFSSRFFISVIKVFSSTPVRSLAILIVAFGSIIRASRQAQGFSDLNNLNRSGSAAFTFSVNYSMIARFS